MRKTVYIPIVTPFGQIVSVIIIETVSKSHKENYEE
jgi:hypothetical protein